ncbi:MAG: flap endonuclease-1 [Patescibacteria group bacterium]|jgi:flap endonuclease-1
MGVNISEIIPKKEIDISFLRDKTVAIDAYNTLYQFLTTIRQSDGTPLKNKSGDITSHISGLFYRNINLLQDGVKPVYVFDGKPPALKSAEIAKRREAKRIAMEKFDTAKSEGDVDNMKKFSSQFVGITKQIIDDSKELLDALGIAWVQAPSEGEAEAAYLARNKKVWAAASQDYDAILYGVPYLVRNLTLARKRKSSSGIYVDVPIEFLEINEVLSKLDVSLDMLICIAIMVGTDYNPGGIKGIGQKKALEFGRQFDSPYELFTYLDTHDKYELNFDWKAIFEQFHGYHSETPEIVFKDYSPEKIREVLGRHDFSADRIQSGIEKLKKIGEAKKQKGLGQFF